MSTQPPAMPATPTAVPGRPPAVSLILATMGRTAELRTFLLHLDAQTFRDFELIVVDQNPDDRLLPILAEWAGSSPLLHLRSRPGLSRARNAGLRDATGEIVAFPDDDCWYPPGLLAEMAQLWTEHDGCAGLLTGRGWDGKPPGGRPRRCTRRSAWKMGGSIFLFLRRELVAALGGFDERLGLAPDTRWRAGEDIDMVLRILATHQRLYYEPRVWVGHPAIRCDRLSRDPGRVREYGRAGGKLMRQHGFSACYYHWRVARTLAATLASLVQGDRAHAATHWNDLVGRVEGWRASGAGQAP